MPQTPNQVPEQLARDRIDAMLRAAGWVIQDVKSQNLFENRGVAIKEYPTDNGTADYALFVDQQPVGIIEAKREEEGHRINTVREQTERYADAKLKYLNNDKLPFLFESTGVITHFTDRRDPKPRAREVFTFYKPATFASWLKKEKSLRARLHDIPTLQHDGLRPAQIIAVENLEESFKKNNPRALIQMATGAGKTFTACTFVYRLLKHAKAKRVLFLVDTKNLGEQAEGEFQAYQPKDDNRKFTELYNVQLLNSSYIAHDSQVCIATIQRMYAALKGEEIEDDLDNENPNEQSTWLQQKLKSKEPLPVVYNEAIPIETFDFIVIDECHRSIYNLWKQVLDYFDAFLIGLTATPDMRTLGFFNKNLVSEYTYEESVTDGVNVPQEIYEIETEITKKGALLKSGWTVEKREKLTRKQRWELQDEEETYTKNNLDRSVVNMDQIRTVIRAFKKALVTDIYPNRINKDGEYEVPKTLVFAKTDSHADDIIKIILEEFSEGNDFCKKVTYKIDEDPKSILNRFRTAYHPRIAVTVDMIATGTDVKPLEVLLFMRDVKSDNYFEQMKGRGTRTIDDERLKAVSSSARTKTHFVIVDAVGVTRGKKSSIRPLERKRNVALIDLMQGVSMGVSDEDLYLSLANRLLRIDRQLSDKEQDKLVALTHGKSLKQMTKALLAAHDPDELALKTQELVDKNPGMDLAFAKAQSQQALVQQAAATFTPAVRDFIENLRRDLEQTIDTHNIDTVLKSAWQVTTDEKARATITAFTAFIEEHIEVLTALSFYYNQPHRRKEVTFNMISEVLDLLKKKKPALAPVAVWNAYGQLDEVRISCPQDELVALVSLIRKVSGIDRTLTAFDATVDKNFKEWIFRKNAGPVQFTPAQMDWLRLLKDHIATSFHVTIDDLDYTPFDSNGGRGKMWQLFGNTMEQLIEEMNEELVA